jgi:hypothetical protein
MARTALVALVAASLCGCEGDVVNLGASAPLTGGGSGASAGSDAAGSVGGGGVAGALTREWLAPKLLFPQDDALIVSNATFAHGERQLVYSEKPRGDDQVARIYERTHSGGSWGSRRELELGTDTSNPAISGDGLELWFGQAVDGGLGETDIWLSRWQGGTWSLPEHGGEPLNSASHDAPRPPAVNCTIMPLMSKRHGQSPLYQLYLATRSAPGQPWQSVSQELLASINSPSFESVDGFLTADGLRLYFSSTRNSGQQGDLFVAQRTNLQAVFGEPRALADLNTGADERDPWLSTDGERLYFSSNQGGQYALYVSEHAP